MKNSCELIIGMDGFCGRHLCERLPDAIRTTRRNAGLDAPNTHYFDLLDQGPLPDADIVYICAGMNGTLTALNAPQICYRGNVDGTVYIAERYRDTGAFVVWIGSTTAEWQLEFYGRSKRYAEIILRTMPHVGIVRAGRVQHTNVDSLCSLMIDVGRNRRRGVFLWNKDEQPYLH